VDPFYRARAYQLLSQIAGRADQFIAAGLQDKSADVRVMALRIAQQKRHDVIIQLERLVQDPSPQVRRQCAIALRHSPSAAAPNLWAQLATEYDGQDRWYLEALRIGADGQWDRFVDAFLARAVEGQSGAAKQ
jgi:hypothetical protein